MRLILASASPRRLDLLARIGVVPHAVEPADIDESVPRGELPRVHAERLAAEEPDLVVTSPPYFGLRSYQDGGEHYAGQIGDEPTSAEFVDALLAEDQAARLAEVE